MNCRHCQRRLKHVFIDLGNQPASNAYLTTERLDEPEVYYPLKAYVCDGCWLVQVPAHASAQQLFTPGYAYFSSTSNSWVSHAKNFVDMAVDTLKLNHNSFVVEVASNDGYLLQFIKAKNIPCLGIEPTASTASVSRKRGIDTIEKFFGVKTARELIEDHRPADLLIANNVLAHVPDINDFVQGIREALSTEGVISLEFPHLLQLVTEGQFDTIYHEHYSYLSLCTVKAIFERHGLKIFDAEKLHTHGGSLRIFAARTEARTRLQTDRVSILLDAERRAGMQTLPFYSGFQQRAEHIKDELLTFLLAQKTKKRSVVGYGAAAKGNTLLNFAGVKPDLLSYVCDAAPSKQGSYLPGSHIPILEPVVLRTRRPDYVLVIPWNIKEEIIESLSYVRDWRGRFVLAIPRLQII